MAGVLPPLAVAALADQRVVMPSRGAQPRVAVFRDRNRLRFGPYVVDPASYDAHAQSYACTRQVASHASLPPERRGGGNVARRHRMRQQAFERR